MAVDKQQQKQGHRGKAVARAMSTFLHDSNPDAQQNVEKPQSMPEYQAQNEWQGWGTATKPAVEEWILIRKPISEKTIAKNVLKHGTGGLNIDACRVGSEGGTKATPVSDSLKGSYDGGWRKERSSSVVLGRFPSHLLLSCCCEEPHTNPDCPCYQLDQQSGITQPGSFPPKRGSSAFFGFGDADNRSEQVGQIKEKPAGASRYFQQFTYCPKVSTKERNMGMEDEPNNHPTVKSIQLMKYLITLITPLSGTVLDPFAGSGSTLLAAQQLGMSSVGIEKEIEYCQIAEKRLAAKLSSKEKK